MQPRVDSRTQDLLRELAPQVLAVMVRRYRHFSGCEDAVQEALLAAATQWPTEGAPDNPRGWLIHVAVRRITDAVRAEASRRHREKLVVSLVPPDEQIALAADAEGALERDDTRDLLFMCCHPALSPSSAIALTLRAVGGLSTAEIAHAFIVPEATMAQRISRAKQTVQTSGIAFELPKPEEFRARIEAVLHVLYLVFNEGYAASAGAVLVRTDLTAEAIRLTRMLHRVAPDEREVAGLLALMLLTDARRAARTGPAGELIPLDQQNRKLWDQRLIDEGTALLQATLPRGAPGPYQVQAAIAALHDEAPSAEATDWPQILALYEVLMSLSDNPMVALSHAVATAMVRGPAAALSRLDVLAKDRRLEGHHRLDAVRAHLLERAGDREAAARHFRHAAERTASTAERDYLLLCAARLSHG